MTARGGEERPDDPHLQERTACLVKQIELCRTIAATLQALQESGDPLVQSLEYAVHEHLHGLLKALDAEDPSHAPT